MRDELYVFQQKYVIKNPTIEIQARYSSWNKQRNLFFYIFMKANLNLKQNLKNKTEQFTLSSNAIFERGNLIALITNTIIL